MRCRLPIRLLILTLLSSSAAATALLAQDTPIDPSLRAAPLTQGNATSTSPAPNIPQVAVPTGTRLPLMLRNGVPHRPEQSYRDSHGLVRARPDSRSEAAWTNSRTGRVSHRA